ncbi:50S ribosomal protein L18Ae [Stygiolobus caldivivus]|uniref:Large ribosomal subunit protein eL20 n=1 Tax=Stygiolobus caldivivus TaxID=2824673 RepID=A0A8D5ZK26_9CREN|nr:50S ribosomal protein L18Ae [Stygiolobus caldivivus]BCU70802.1 50S ribosomal protein LX [Stygiolobus caldivivus]
MSEIKVFMVRGTALFNEAKFPTRQKFVRYIRALNEKQALEKIYSDFGGKNKIKRYNIKIEEIKEVKVEEINDKTARDLAKLEKIIL